MVTEYFESIFLGQDAFIHINEEGGIADITFRLFPNVKIRLSEEEKARIAVENEHIINLILKQNNKDSEDYDDHQKIESDKGKFI